MSNLTPSSRDHAYERSAPLHHARAKSERAYEIRMDWARRGKFTHLLDAIEAAKIVKRENPLSNVAVRDLSTEQIVIEIEL